MSLSKEQSGKQNLLVLGALGVVYGDIGTSPLYTLRECLSHSAKNGVLDPLAIFGVLSLIFWAIILVVCLKYITFVMQADNNKEGGIFSLLALAQRTLINSDNEKLKRRLLFLGVMGAALFYGDCIITPAISVLSAVEGLQLVQPSLEKFVVPISLFILTLLFMLQSRGTASVGKLFGPVMLIWFSAIGVLGGIKILENPEILQALNPIYGLKFLFSHGFESFFILGSVVLALTGGEALYADMGHFGRIPIRKAWFWIVFPSLVLNYFGQGALLLSNPKAIENPFFMLAPSWFILPLVILATLATVIASQAVITGAYSMTRQAIQLSFCPRLEVRFTSDEEYGQIYVPWVNWLLFMCVIATIFGFQSSSNLASAYGIAVTGTMVITTILASAVALFLWKWNKALVVGVFGTFLFIDLAFFSANTVKVFEGGWFPLLIGMFSFIFMSTWKAGRVKLAEYLKNDAMPLKSFLGILDNSPMNRVSGTSIFLTGSIHGVPQALLHNLKHNKVLHERVVLMTILTKDIPRVEDHRKIQVKPLGHNFYRLIIRSGFKEIINFTEILERCKEYDLEFNMMETSFFVSREHFVPSQTNSELERFRENLFIIMSKNAVNITDFLQIPTNRVVELGTQVNL